MKLTTKVRYAARAMLDVAIHEADGPVPMKEIAKRQGIPESYLRQLAIPLKTADLIKVSRGSRGGLQLVRPPSEIKISEIGIAMEGRVSLVECVYDPAVCPRSKGCPTRELWTEMTNSIIKVMESRSLQDLAHCIDDPAE